MKCIVCHQTTRVVNTRHAGGNDMVTWRRRQCTQCNRLFTTYERLSQADYPNVQGQDGVTSTLSTPRLLVSILKDLPPDNDAADAAYALAVTIIQKLTTETVTLTERLVATTAHQTLKAYSPAAGISYGLRMGLVRPSHAPRRQQPRV